MTDIYLDVDVDAIYLQAMRAVRRCALEVYVISRDYLPVEENVHLIAIENDQVNGSSWIAANILRGDICVTADPDVAATCINRGALALSPAGRQWGDPDSQAFPEQWRADPRAFAQRLDRAILSIRATSTQASASRRDAAPAGFTAPGLAIASRLAL
jgi:hypothetical protein